jgi:RNA polymerase sigma-70 factor (ECF subfamily)
MDLTPSLLVRLRAADASAGALLEELYRDALRRFCRGYVRDAAEVEDAVQDVFCKVLAADVVPDDFRAWLYRTARNHCLNLVRARGRRREAGVPLSELAPGAGAAGPLTGLLAGERREQVVTALAALPEADREVLLLRYSEGLARDEIASVLGLPVSIVKSRLHEGLEKLRRRLPP